ncbi:MAG: hypothetical protein Q9159_000651 [Coniocarpon cinnabarinum]
MFSKFQLPNPQERERRSIETFQMVLRQIIRWSICQRLSQQSAVQKIIQSSSKQFIWIVLCGFVHSTSGASNSNPSKATLTLQDKVVVVFCFNHVIVLRLDLYTILILEEVALKVSSGKIDLA